MKFTGQPKHDKVNVDIPYRATHDEDLSLALIETVRLLASAVGAARGQDISAEPEDVRWSKEFLVGFCLLAIGEARSILLLLSDNLNRHARVHLRSLYEYELRTKKLLQEPQRALAFRDSIAYEMRQIGVQLNGSMDLLEAEIAETLGVEDSASIVGSKENAAFGGPVRNQMKDEVAPEKRYVGTFAWASLVSHGSILALRELSGAVSGAREDLLKRASVDNKENVLLYNACWLLLWFSGKLHEQFGVAVPGIKEVADRIVAINKRLGLISAAQESAARRALQEHRKAKRKD